MSYHERPGSSGENGIKGSFITKYILSCGAATVAETVTYPLDLTKTRMQLHIRKKCDEADRRRVGLIRTAFRIAKREGLLYLFQGLRPAILRHYIYTGVRMPVYEEMRDRIFIKHVTPGVFPIWAAMLSGVSAGVISQFLSSPTDLIKVQMQMTGLKQLPTPGALVLPTSSSIIGTAKELYLQGGGPRALWRGVVPNCQRAALVNMADMATYDNMKQYLLTHRHWPDNYLTHVVASSCSGLAAALMSTPSDVIKTRIMNQPLQENGRGLLYHSSMDCLTKTVNHEGFFALYKGFLPIWARMAPWSLTFWVSYEEIRKICGAKSF